MVMHPQTRNLYITKEGMDGMYKAKPTFSGGVLTGFVQAQGENIDWQEGGCAPVDDGMGIAYVPSWSDFVVVNGTGVGTFPGFYRVEDGRCPGPQAATHKP